MGQRKLKYGTVRHIGCRPQSSPMRFDDRMTDRQSHPQAAAFGRVKGLEQLLCGTIRLKLLKIGALVRLSVRRLKVAMASVFPYQQEYRSAYVLLGAAAR